METIISAGFIHRRFSCLQQEVRFILKNSQTNQSKSPTEDEGYARASLLWRLL